MKPASAVVGIIVLILWFLGATLIAAPSNVIDMIIPPGLKLGTNVIQLLGIGTFILAALLIAIYTSLSNDGVSEKKATNLSPTGTAVG